MSYEVYAVVYGDDPPEVWSLYASRAMAEKDVKQYEGTSVYVESMKVWEESDRITEELVKEKG